VQYIVYVVKSTMVLYLVFDAWFLQVEAGVDEVLFNLIILGSLVNSDGFVWQVKRGQYYIVECMPLISEVNYYFS